MSGTSGRAAPGAAVASLAALALVTAGLQAAVVAIDSGDAGAAIAASIGVWFQGLWAVFAWRRPGRDVLVAGLVANLALLAVSAARLATRSGPAQPSEVLVAVFELVLVAGLGWTLARPWPASAAPATPRSAWLTGTLAAVLAVASLLATGPAFAPPGVASPIVGAAVAPTSSTAQVVSSSSAQPSLSASPTDAGASQTASASPTDPGLSQTASSTPGASPISTSTPAAPGTAAPSAPSTPGPATAATPAAATPTPAATPSPPASATATPRPTAATPGPKGNPSTPRPTPRPAATQTPSPKPTPPPTPRPTPSATASKTPAPTPAPTAGPTPSPTQPPVEAAHPGTITFGSDYDPATLAIIGATTTIHRGELVAWRADLTEPAGSTTLTFTVTEPNPPGPEFPHWQQDFSVPDASYVVIVNRVDLSVYVHGDPGTFIMRIRRGQTVLAQGQFRLIP